MAGSTIFAASSHAASQQAPQSLGSHRHGGHRHTSLSDIDAQGSSVATPPSATGKLGTKVNLTV